MTDSPGAHRRRSIRLMGYDYARNGAYFLTICTQSRACLLGDIVDGEMRLNDAGRMVQDVWNALPLHYAGVGIDACVVMPNHLHGIVVIDHVGATPRGRPDGPGVHADLPHLLGPGQAGGPAPTVLSLPEVVQRLKSLTTRRYIDGVRQYRWPGFDGRLWQRNYYEHIIRDEDALHRIREYVANNPMQWAMDRENPAYAERKQGES